MPPHAQLTPPTKQIGSPSPSISYTPRCAVRIVAFNAQGDIAILHAARENYYKLPGGGIQPGEDHETAARREFLEETGGIIRLRTNLKYGNGGNDDEDNTNGQVDDANEDEPANEHNDTTMTNGCFAITQEFRLQQCQTSYCYIADLVADTGKTALEEEEVEDGLKHMWVSLNEAKRLVEGAVPESEFGRSVREREMYFLGEVGRLLGV
ncbi:hypothetical protein B0J18DRAFT_77780 [Chaetomium sp. MPI-SDFR-AT-0129]|nr:hypothetical protein B0J18DRAFT_77780 [Chaetomium sp. MPI-SDFR-AT-0129]